MKMAARKPKKSTLDMAAIIAATKEGNFVYTSATDHADALAQGLVEVNPSMTNDAGAFATRATQKAIDTMTQTNTPVPAESAKPSFAIDDGIPLAAVVGRGRGTETYPFDKLNVGQSFFVPATAERPNPAKSLASTVSSAQRRYAETVEGQTRTNRKGEEVPATKATRKFEMRAVEENGVKGARIWRTA
jgi:hypothetical protein